VAIIGGGITGVSTAYHLSQLGIPCTLLEAKLLTSGASSKNLGMVTPGTEHDFSEAVRKFGRQNAISYWNTSINGISEMEKTLRKEGLAHIFQRTGHLNVALNERTLPLLREEHRAMRSAGIDARWLEGDTLSKYVRSPSILAGIRVPATCAVHPPTALVHGLAHAAADNGATIVEQARVLRIEQDKLITSRGRLKTDAAVIATEGFTPHGWMPYHLHTREDFAISTQPLPPSWFEKNWPGNELVWNYGVHYHAFKKSPDGRVFLFATEGARKGFSEFFPGTRVRATHRWTCRIAGYKDQKPRIGRHPALKNVFFAGGYRGHGLVFGFMAGRILAEMIAGNKNKDAKLFAP
jgi:glycine/D-amino acid oxidase-like deaminating enzyme